MTAKTKLILKNCTRLVSFILILLLLLYGISFLLEPKNNDDAAGFVNPIASGYLSLEKDTLDVFIVGNSDAYSGFSPMDACKIACERRHIVVAPQLCKALRFQFLAKFSHTSFNRNTFKGKVFLCHSIDYSNKE